MAERPEEWKWSSCSATIGLRKVHEYLMVDWILRQFGSKKKEAQKDCWSFKDSLY
jgi:hypothetical protein